MEQNHIQRNIPSEDQQGQYNYTGMNQHQAVPSAWDMNLPDESEAHEREENYRDVIFDHKKNGDKDF